MDRAHVAGAMSRRITVHVHSSNEYGYLTWPWRLLRWCLITLWWVYVFRSVWRETGRLSLSAHL